MAKQISKDDLDAEAIRAAMMLDLGNERRDNLPLAGKRRNVNLSALDSTRRLHQQGSPESRLIRGREDLTEHWKTDVAKPGKGDDMEFKPDMGFGQSHREKLAAGLRGSLAEQQGRMTRSRSNPPARGAFGHGGHMRGDSADTGIPPQLAAFMAAGQQKKGKLPLVAGPKGKAAQRAVSEHLPPHWVPRPMPTGRGPEKSRGRGGFDPSLLTSQMDFMSRAALTKSGVDAKAAASKDRQKATPETLISGPVLRAPPPQQQPPTVQQPPPQQQGVKDQNKLPTKPMLQMPPTKAKPQQQQQPPKLEQITVSPKPKTPTKQKSNIQASKPAAPSTNAQSAKSPGTAKDKPAVKKDAPREIAPKVHGKGNETGVQKPVPDQGKGKLDPAKDQKQTAAKPQKKDPGPNMGTLVNLEEEEEETPASEHLAELMSLLDIHDPHDDLIGLFPPLEPGEIPDTANPAWLKSMQAFSQVSIRGHSSTTKGKEETSQPRKSLFDSIASMVPEPKAAASVLPREIVKAEALQAKAEDQKPQTAATDSQQMIPNKRQAKAAPEESTAKVKKQQQQQNASESTAKSSTKTPAYLPGKWAGSNLSQSQFANEKEEPRSVPGPLPSFYPFTSEQASPEYTKPSAASSRSVSSPFLLPPVAQQGRPQPNPAPAPANPASLPRRPSFTLPSPSIIQRTALSPSNRAVNPNENVPPYANVGNILNPAASSEQSQTGSSQKSGFSKAIQRSIGKSRWADS